MAAKQGYQYAAQALAQYFPVPLVPIQVFPVPSIIVPAAFWQIPPGQMSQTPLAQSATAASLAETGERLDSAPDLDSAPAPAPAPKSPT